MSIKFIYLIISFPLLFLGAEDEPKQPSAITQVASLKADAIKQFTLILANKNDRQRSDLLWGVDSKNISNAFAPKLGPVELSLFISYAILLSQKDLRGDVKEIGKFNNIFFILKPARTALMQKNVISEEDWFNSGYLLCRAFQNNVLAAIIDENLTVIANSSVFTPKIPSTWDTVLGYSAYFPATSGDYYNEVYVNNQKKNQAAIVAKLLGRSLPEASSIYYELIDKSSDIQKEIMLNGLQQGIFNDGKKSN